MAAVLGCFQRAWETSRSSRTDGAQGCTRDMYMCFVKFATAGNAAHNRSRAPTVCRANNLVEYGVQVLRESNPIEKKNLTQEAYKLFSAGTLTVGQGCDSVPTEWARESRPAIVEPDAMPNPKQMSGSPVLFYLHSLAHVELNAMNLCWDTIVRFRDRCDLPEEFYHDMLKIADDESRHFAWLSHRLFELGSTYGDFPAHQLISIAAFSTTSNLAERLAIAQLVQEARGLDAAPRVAERLNSWADHKSAKIVSTIGYEEVDHVRTGIKWYLFVCERENTADPVARFHEIAMKNANYGAFSPPFNHDRRRAAGLDESWYMPISEAFARVLQDRKSKSRMRGTPN